MKNMVNYTLVFLVLFGVWSCTETKDKQTVNSETGIYKNVDVATFKELVESGSGILVDVRTDAEVAEGHLRDAVHIDFYSDAFDHKIGELSHTSAIYVYCASGNRSGQAMGILKTMGFTEVYNLKGGIGAWYDKGYPIEK